MSGTSMLGPLTAADGSDGAARSVPTKPVDSSQAVLGTTKAALVDQGDDLVASEISAQAAYGRAARDRSSRKRGFTFVDERQNEVDNPHAASIDGDEPLESFTEVEEGAALPRTLAGIEQTVQKKAEPEVVPSPVAPQPVGNEVKAPQPPPQIGRVVGNVIVKANFMDMKLPVTALGFEDPVLTVFTPEDADNHFNPPRGAEGIEMKFPPGIREHLPEELEEKIWYQIMPAGITYPVPQFRSVATMFYLKPKGG